MKITYLSLGWGVQSFTLAVMAALGYLKGLDLAVHADTTHEASATYDFARRWTPWLAERGVDVVTVQATRTLVLQPNTGGKAQYSVFPPAYSLGQRDLKRGQLKRQCTDNWKIRPVNRYLRSLLPGGRTRPGCIEAWLGISLDEWYRMKDAKVQYVRNRWPLVELRMTRADCKDFLKANGLEVPPKSACVFCPYHSRDHWLELRREGGVDWEYAVAADQAVRDAREREGFDLFLHRARVPLPLAVSAPWGSEDEDGGPCDGGVCEFG